jgi:nucleoside-diphosphate-sugar epimerase
MDPALALAVNAGGTVHLLEAVKERGVERIVLVGTCYEYGARKSSIEGLDPFNAYAASKVAAWAFGRMYWRAHGLPVVTVRPFQVYGPGQPAHMLIPAAIDAALNGKNFSMTPGEQERDFVFVADIVLGMLAAACAAGIEGQSLDLGTGQVHSARQVVERIWTITGAQGRVLPGALPYRTGAVMHSVADADRTARLTGWRATTALDAGLQQTIQGFAGVTTQAGG